MDSGSNASGGMHSGHFSLGSTAYEEFVQDLDSPRGTAGRQPAVGLRQQQYSSSSGGGHVHPTPQIDKGYTGPTPFAAPPRASSSASGFALPGGAGISSRWFTAPPSSHPLTSASLENKATQSGSVSAVGFASQPFLAHVRGMEEDAGNARSSAVDSAHSLSIPSNNPSGGTASNTILLVDSNTGAILGTADPRLMMQPQGGAGDAAQGVGAPDSTMNLSGANSTTTTLSANSAGQSQAQQSQQQQAVKPQLEQPNYQSQLAGDAGLIENLLHQQHSTGPTAASAIAQQLLAHPQQLTIQQAESFFQQLANAGVDDETLLTVATATGLIASDAQGNMVLASSSSNSQPSQQQLQSASTSAATNLVDAQHRLSPGVLQQLAVQQQQQQQGQQQPSSSMATLAALLQSAASGVSNKANAGAGLGPAKQHTLYKTELCRGWLESGTCRYGSKCQFAHGREELRPVPRHPKYKTEVCRSYLATGVCTYGPRCRFIHSALPGMPSLAPGASTSGGITIGSLLASMGAAGNQQQQQQQQGHGAVRHSAPNVLDWVPLLHNSGAANAAGAGSGSATQMGLEGVSGWDDQPVMSGPTLSGFERPGSFDNRPPINMAPLPSLPAQAAAAQNLLRSMGPPGASLGATAGASGAQAGVPRQQPNLFALRASTASSQQAAAAALLAQANKSSRLSADGLAPAGAGMAWNAGDRAAALWAANQSNISSRAAGHSLDGGSTAYSLDLISRSSFDTTQRSSLDSARVGTSRTSLDSMQRGTGNFGSGIALNSVIAGGRASLDSATSRDARSLGGDMSEADYTLDGTFSPSKALPPLPRGSAADPRAAGSSFGMMMMAAAQGNNPAVMMAPIPEGKALDNALPAMAQQQQQQQQEGAYASHLYTTQVMSGGRHSPQDLN